MTGDEAKQALLNGSQVVWNSPAQGQIVYERINAIRYTRYKNRFSVSLELLDRSNRSISIVPLKEAEIYQEQKE